MTFLFTDIEGSTKLFHELGDTYMAVLEEHHRRMRAAIVDHHGVEVKTEGDAFFVAFEQPSDAVGACLAAQLALGVEEGWPHGRVVKVRMGVHTGPVSIVDDDYVGLSVHEAARIAAAAHGGQVLVSEDTAGLVGGCMPPLSDLRDLGRHALKDFPEPRRLFQLTHPGLGLAFPPLRTLTARGHNLPSATASFVGRAAEVASIQELLLGDARLVSLIGSGGMGKSRLAIEAGWSLLSWFPEGVWFVGLAPVSGPAGVLPVICDALGVADTPGTPREDSLRQRLAVGSILLIVDNLEHVLDAATVLSDLLASCPPLRMLATSRERLRLRGEHVMQIEALALPPAGAAPDEVLRSDAGRLFTDRATAHLAGFALDPGSAPAVIEICTRLDGVPLALELAAARTFDMPVAELASRLGAALDVLTEGERDLPTRQQTLRATVAWSYELLKPAAQELLCALSVFPGGSNLEAIQKVDPSAKAAVLDTLVEASLLRQSDPARVGPVRWWMLETVRQFAAERLAEAGLTAKLVASHAAWALALADRAAPELVGPDQAQWLDTLEADHANLNAAIERASASTRLAIAARLIRFWSIRGHWTEGRQLLDVALGDAGLAGDGDPSDRAEALLGAGHLAMRQLDIDQAVPRLRECAELAEELGLDALAANALNQLGEVALSQGDSTEATSQKSRALALAREAGDQRLTAMIINDLARLTFVIDGASAAIPFFQEAVSGLRQIGAHRNVAEALSNLALCQSQTGDLVSARAAMEQVLAVAEELGDGLIRARGLSVMGEIELEAGNADEGISRISQATEIFIAENNVADLGEPVAGLARRLPDRPDVAALVNRAADHLRRLGYASDADALLEMMTGASSGPAAGA